ILWPAAAWPSRTSPSCNTVVVSLVLKAQLAPGVTLLQALGIEVIVSFQLVLCILATSGSKRDPSKGGHLVIGLSVMLGHLVAIGYTGCSMNPARSLGPALITFEFANHWWLTMLQEGPKAERNLQSKAESTPQEMGLSEAIERGALRSKASDVPRTMQSRVWGLMDHGKRPGCYLSLPLCSELECLLGLDHWGHISFVVL
uniref:Uncharacterized protein n=1 Tax=Gopherus agassizii TaxID=38772 RepID=A0A452INS7_9SAUR